MFQVSWGGRMVSLSAAVMAELPDPVRLSLLGILRVAVPDPAVPLIDLKATFAGQYDSAEPSAFLMASLTGSHIAGVPLDGDVLVLSRGGPDANFILSAGGFHPAYPIPRGVPALRRLSMNLAPVPWIQLRCQAYFAVTSNTVQFGAQLSLVAEIAGCGLRGQFGLDVLIHLEPSLSFTANMRGSLAVEVFGESLLGVAFDLTLEGPAPWHAVGREASTCFCSVRRSTSTSAGATRHPLCLPPPYRPGDAAPGGLLPPGHMERGPAVRSRAFPGAAVPVRQPADRRRQAGAPARQPCRPAAGAAVRRGHPAFRPLGRRARRALGRRLGRPRRGGRERGGDRGRIRPRPVLQAQRRRARRQSRVRDLSVRRTPGGRHLGTGRGRVRHGQSRLGDQDRPRPGTRTAARETAAGGADRGAHEGRARGGG
ncbi:DUF6603 domain-containing protein [Streptomyces sp. S1D4-11]